MEDQVIIKQEGDSRLFRDGRMIQIRYL